MEHSLGVKPVHAAAIRSSELCGSCHTVHLPVLAGGKVIGHIYEQTTYPEWAFSAYRTGDAPAGPLPLGAGPLAESCQSCHMPSKDAGGRPYRSKIAGIQEHSNFPPAEHALGVADIDLPVREAYARHTPGRPPQPGRHRGGALEIQGGEHRAGGGGRALSESAFQQLVVLELLNLRWQQVIAKPEGG